jgi:hypothetical protein
MTAPSCRSRRVVEAIAAEPAARRPDSSGPSSLPRPRSAFDPVGMSSRDATSVDRLSRDECFVLLRSVPVGRVAITDRAVPAILPVNFMVHGSDVIIRSVAGSKLAAATRGAVVAFEADAYDPIQRTGWSVLLVGVARHVTDPVEVEELSRLGLRPYIDGAASHYMRIPATQISGRRLRPPATAASRGR